MPKYDVFLSHNSADKAAVEELARRLSGEAGLQPFLDKWHLIPGEPWQEALEEALDSSHSCVVFLGPEGLGTWENEEMRVALDIRAGRPDFRVIPVLLPGAPFPERGRLPRFLARVTWVDFRSGLDDADAFHRLVSGIQGFAPGPKDITQDEAVCPFRGLQVFEEEHARFFFGREALDQHLVEQLREDRFLAVIGPSGSGKSSLARAGLVPQIRGGALPASARWPVVVVKPGPRPLETLTARLVPHLNGSADPLAAGDSLRAALRRDERGLHRTVLQVLASAPDSQRLLLLVDQFEELFTLCHDDAARADFIANLIYASAIAGGQTVAVVTMRADFFGQCAAYPELAARLAERDVLVGPMSEEELRRAMESPAEAVGLRYEKGLVDTVLGDLGNEPGTLPLLQHTLLELWERRRGGWLTTDAYHQIGGVRGALAQRADAIYEGLAPGQQSAARRVLLRLTQPGEGTGDTRRRATLAELLPAEGESADVEAAVQKLTDARLLTAGEDEQGAEIVDVAHEALIRGWPRLQRWIDEDRDALRTHRRLTEAANEWERHSRDAGYLYHSTQLIEATDWARTHSDALSLTEAAFLNRSLKAHRRSIAIRNALRAVALALIVGLLLAMVAELGPFAPRFVWASVEDFSGQDVSTLTWAGDGTMYVGMGRGAPVSSLARSRDGGVTWEFLDLHGTFLRNLMFDPVSPNVIYASFTADGLMRSQDGGNTWNSIGRGLPVQDVEALVSSPAGVLYAGDQDEAQGVYVSRDQGTTWAPLAGSPESAVSFLGWVDDRLLVGTSEGLWQWDVKAGWRPLFRRAGQIYSAVYADDVLFVGGDGIFELRQDLEPQPISDFAINNIDVIPLEVPQLIASEYNGKVLKWDMGEAETEIIAQPEDLAEATWLYFVHVEPGVVTRIWAGTDTGLHVGEMRRWHQFWRRWAVAESGHGS